MPRKLDSHQVVGIAVIAGVIAGLVGLAAERLDWAIMAGFLAFVAAALVGPRGRGGSGAGDSGVYELGDGDCGGGGD